MTFFKGKLSIYWAAYRLPHEGPLFLLNWDETFIIYLFPFEVQIWRERLISKNNHVVKAYFYSRN